MIEGRFEVASRWHGKSIETLTNGLAHVDTVELPGWSPQIAQTWRLKTTDGLA